MSLLPALPTAPRPRQVAALRQVHGRQGELEGAVRQVSEQIMELATSQSLDKELITTELDAAAAASEAALQARRWGGASLRAKPCPGRVGPAGGVRAAA